MKKTGLLNSEQARDSYQLISKYSRDAAGRENYYYYTDSLLLVIYRKDVHDGGSLESQLELPVASLWWIRRSIADGFYKLPSEGGFDSSQHACSSIESGEDLMLVRSMNVEYSKPGFKIINKSRPSYIMDSLPQSLQITDDEVENYFIPAIDRVMQA